MGLPNEAPGVGGVIATGFLGTSLGLIAGTAYLVTLGHPTTQLAPHAAPLAVACLVHLLVVSMAMVAAVRRTETRWSHWSGLPVRGSALSALSYALFSSLALTIGPALDPRGDFLPHLAGAWVALPAVVHAATLLFGLDEFVRGRMRLLPHPALEGLRVSNRLQRRFLLLFALLPSIPVIGLGFALAHAVNEHDARAFHDGVQAAGSAPFDVHLGIPLVCLSVATISILLGWLGARSLFRPIRALTAAMEKAAAGDLTSRAAVSSDDEIGRATVIFNEMTRGLSEREWLRENFGRYVSKEVVEALRSGRIGLEGEQRLVSVLFADIRNFTSLAENMPPPALLRFLNDYVDLMIDAVTQHGGHVDKIMGDGLMVVFGAPVEDAAHAQRAVRAALAMKAALARYNLTRAQRDEVPLRIGIGIHSGQVITGNVGCPSYKMEYTALGDTVNLAARVEALTKELGADLLVTQETATAVAAEFGTTLIREVQVRGRSSPVRVFKVDAA